MSELTLNPGIAVIPGDKLPAALPLPTAPPRRKDEARPRRRLAATRLAAANDGDFRLFRVY